MSGFVPETGCPRTMKNRFCLCEVDQNPAEFRSCSFGTLWRILWIGKSRLHLEKEVGKEAITSIVVSWQRWMRCQGPHVGI